jgi:Cu+-exporting ATPase
MVYQLLDTSGLCNYYQLNDHPGRSRRVTVRKDKFAFLDETKMARRLVSFKDDQQSHATLYLPQIHCSSCLYLLENLHRLEEGVVSSRIDFAAKKITVIFDHRSLSLRQVAELLTSLGYEPYISLHDLGDARPGIDKSLIYQLGIAGFCFGNIMLFSFPEYLGLDLSEALLQKTFRYLNFLLSLPVLLYSARPFYMSAWKGLRHKFLNIDAPIVLAILVTFSRSIWEIGSGKGSGYFDSMSGIIFFMLAGRILQDKTYRQLSFERDYTAYFPMAVTVLGSDGPASRALPDLRAGDTLRIHSGELIPADGILSGGEALIDYSFVTGESLPVGRNIGELVYAGGRQTGGAIEVLVVKEVVQSYLTQLWNRRDDSQNRKSLPANPDDMSSFVHLLSRYFTYIVLIIALAAAGYWTIHNPSNTWNAVTAVLIVACPCALLLSASFTNGNLLRILAGNQFYLRNAQTIGRIASAGHIVFDKTGTLTDTGTQDITWQGQPLTATDRRAIAALAAQSLHPLSKALLAHLNERTRIPVKKFKELPGKGIDGFVDSRRISIGSPAFVASLSPAAAGLTPAFTGGTSPSAITRIAVAIDGRLLGSFGFSSHYREGLSGLISRLSPRWPLSVLSGDTAREQPYLSDLFGPAARLVFGQSPEDKAAYIEGLQSMGKKVMMIGDGLNDAGALSQSDIGIAISDDCNTFTPASDAILQAARLPQLPAFIRLCRAGKNIILTSFVLSIVYNLIGLSFAVRAVLSPMTAAILMPASSLSILLVTYGSSCLAGRRLLPASNSPARKPERNFPEKDQPCK